MKRQPRGQSDGGQFAPDVNAESNVLLEEPTKDESARTREDAFLEEAAENTVEHYEQWWGQGVDDNDPDNWETWTHADMTVFYDNLLTMIQNRRQYSAEQVALAEAKKRFES